MSAFLEGLLELLATVAQSVKPRSLKGLALILLVLLACTGLALVLRASLE